MPTIDIVGSGVAGLALAAAIDRPDWQIRLHDDRPDEGVVGTAFGMWPAAMRALDRIGVAEQVRHHGLRLDHAQVRNRRGGLLQDVSGVEIWMVTRPTLRRLLRDRVPATTTFEPHRVTDPGRLDGDVVVGADGVHSVVRRHLWGARSVARSAPVTVLRGVVPRDLGLSGLQEWWGRGDQFGATPNPGSETNWFATIPERRFPDTEAALAHARERYAAYPDQVREVLSLAEPARTLINGISISRPLTHVVSGRAVLIGDAAHAMAPNLGRGACEAIRDAVCLGGLLTRHEPADALARYRYRRLVQPQLIKSAATLVMRVALADRRAAPRDRVLGLLAREPRGPVAAVTPRLDRSGRHG